MAKKTSPSPEQPAAARPAEQHAAPVRDFIIVPPYVKITDCDTTATAVTLPVTVVAYFKRAAGSDPIKATLINTSDNTETDVSPLVPPGTLQGSVLIQLTSALLSMVGTTYIIQVTVGPTSGTAQDSEVIARLA